MSCREGISGKLSSCRDGDIGVEGGSDDPPLLDQSCDVSVAVLKAADML